MAMIVKAVKLTKDLMSTKVVYEKDGILYMRSGQDLFQVGKKLIVPLKSLLNKHGFKSVGDSYNDLDDQPVFKDAGDIVDNITNFQTYPDGKVKYQRKMVL